MSTTEPLTGVRFHPGQIIMTRAVHEWVLIAHDAPAPIERARLTTGSLRRHVVGDWGDVDSEDRATNERSVDRGGRLMSVYPIPDELRGDAPDDRLWIITEHDRSVTTILFPSDY